MGEEEREQGLPKGIWLAETWPGWLHVVPFKKQEVKFRPVSSTIVPYELQRGVKNQTPTELKSLNTKPATKRPLTKKR